jgi:hypothetical protein
MADHWGCNGIRYPWAFNSRVQIAHISIQSRNQEQHRPELGYGMKLAPKELSPLLDQNVTYKAFGTGMQESKRASLSF